MMTESIRIALLTALIQEGALWHTSSPQYKQIEKYADTIELNLSELPKDIDYLLANYSSFAEYEEAYDKAYKVTEDKRLELLEKVI